MEEMPAKDKRREVEKVGRRLHCRSDICAGDGEGRESLTLQDNSKKGLVRSLGKVWSGHW